MRNIARFNKQNFSRLLSLCLVAMFSSVHGDPLSLAPSTSSSEYLTASLEKQLQSIEELELDYGPYDLRLKEAFKGLGFQLKNAGDYQGAKIAYDRALQVSRVNEGLYSATQIRLVESMIELDLKLANWDEVNDHYGYLEHLYKRIYDKDDPRLEEGLKKVVAWHIDASNINLNGNRMTHLRKVNSLMKLRLEVAELTLSGEDPMFDFLKQDIARSERSLFMASDLRKEMMRQRARHRERYLATRN